jgi:hypothetical protein
MSEEEERGYEGARGDHSSRLFCEKLTHPPEDGNVS